MVCFPPNLTDRVNGLLGIEN